MKIGIGSSALWHQPQHAAQVAELPQNSDSTATRAYWGIFPVFTCWTVVNILGSEAIVRGNGLPKLSLLYIDGKPCSHAYFPIQCAPGWLSINTIVLACVVLPGYSSLPDNHSEPGNMENPKIDAALYLITVLLNRLSQSDPALIDEMIQGIEADRSAVPADIPNRSHIDAIFDESLDLLQQNLINEPIQPNEADDLADALEFDE